MRRVRRTLTLDALERALVCYLGAAAALLSFDALRARALGEAASQTAIIPLQAILPRPVLAGVWASVIDVAAAAGILGLRRTRRRDRTAWCMFVLASVASIGFQMFTPWVALGRAVPPVALFLAVVVLKLPEDFPEPVVPLDGEEPDLEELEERQAELDAKVETERARLEEQLTNTRLRAQVRRARNRASLMGIPVNDFTIEDWRAVLAEHEHRCAYCGTGDAPLSIEHRTPLHRGGEHTRANIAPACEPCNLSKGTKTVEEWEQHKASLVQLHNTPGPYPRKQRALTPDEARRVTPLAAQGLKAYTIARQTGIREPVVRQHLRDHAPVSTNGSRP
jgi:5-methylcytosine-specific restriction endonuclease McrA